MSDFCQERHGWIDSLEDLMGASAENMKITIFRTEAPDTELGYTIDVLIERGDDVREMKYLADIIGAWSFNEAMREAITEAYASLPTTR